MMLTLMSLSSLPWALRIITWERHKSVFRSWVQEELCGPVYCSRETCSCYLVDTRFFSPWVDHRKVNAVSPGITMLNEVLFVTKDD